ncbi:MAG: PEP-CTERM sorting domain-containing protein [Verrucomicrobiota bacterium]|jgi:hypothetical protein
MTIRSVLLFTAATLFSCSISKANIISLSYQDDGDGAIVCPNGWNGDTSALDIYGRECMSGPAHVLGTITTDTEADPTLTLASGVDNDTGFAWTGYQVNVVMSNPFTIVSGSPSVSSPSSDWNVSSTVEPTLQGSGLYSGKYEGTINLSDGTPLAVGDELDFSYAIHFSGSTSYSFTQEMIPTLVPEPSTLSLVLGGLLLGKLGVIRRR